MSKKQSQVQPRRKTEKLKSQSTRKGALTAKALQWYSKGLSLREIGEKMDCSHQHVKRLLDTIDSLPTFDWSGELLSPQELRKRLRSMAKEHCGTIWIKVSKRYNWIEQCLATVFESPEDPETRTELFSKLLSSGPSRPGRPRCQEASSLDSGERKWKKVIPISQIVRRRADGSELSYTEVQDRVMTDHFKILAGQSVAKTAFRPRRVAPNGKPFEPCPICHRLTAYSVSCIIKRDGEIFRKTVLSFKSKRCKAGSCAGKRVHAPTEPKTSVGGRVRRVST